MSDVLLVAIDPALAERFDALPGHRVVSVGGRAPAEPEPGPGAGFHPDIVFVGAGVSHDAAMAYATRVIADWPGLTVVLVAEQTRKLTRRALQAGFQHVIAESISDVELGRIIGAATIASAEDRPVTARHRVVVVASPKGGVGKTTTAVNLAAVLAKAAPWEVALIDLDLQFGDVSSMLDLDSQHTIVDALSADGADSMFVRTLLTVHTDGFYVLGGAAGPADSAGVTGEQIRKLIAHLSASFRYVVIDTSAGLLEETLSSLEEASDLVLVTALDVATVRSTRKELDVLGDLALLPSGVHLLLNRADRRSGLSVRDVERMLGRPITTIVSFSDRIALAANHGMLAVDAKRTPLRKPLHALATSITDPTTRHRTHRGEKLV